MHSELPWGMMIVIYLFTAGLSAGAMAASNIALLRGGARYERIVCWGAYISPFPIALGTGLLLLDLGSPLNFYRLFLTLQVRSPMSYGSWAILIFIMLSLVNFYIWLPDSWHIVKWPGNRAKWQYGLARFLPVLCLIVSSYTGFLLEAAYRPLWHTLFLPGLFLVSALSTGVAAVIFMAAVSRQGGTRHEELHILTKVDIMLIVAELALFLALILAGQFASLSEKLAIVALLSGRFAWMFWLLIIVCGLLLPLSLEIMELKGRLPLKWALPVTVFSSFLVLFGGFFVRYVITYAGQISSWIS